MCHLGTSLGSDRATCCVLAPLQLEEPLTGDVIPYSIIAGIDSRCHYLPSAAAKVCWCTDNLDPNLRNFVQREAPPQ